MLYLSLLSKSCFTTSRTIAMTQATEIRVRPHYNPKQRIQPRATGSIVIFLRSRLPFSSHDNEVYLHTDGIGSVSPAPDSVHEGIACKTSLSIVTADYIASLAALHVSTGDGRPGLSVDNIRCCVQLILCNGSMLEMER